MYLMIYFSFRTYWKARSILRGLPRYVVCEHETSAHSCAYKQKYIYALIIMPEKLTSP